VIHKGVTIDHTASQSYTNDHLNPIPCHSQHLFKTIYSREDPRPLVTASLAIMIVVHFAKVSALYPHVVISSLLGQLENLLFAILKLPLVYDP
jgi:hypothetical protein